MKTAQIEIYQEKAVLATLKFNALKDKIDRVNVNFMPSCAEY